MYITCVLCLLFFSSRQSTQNQWVVTIYVDFRLLLRNGTSAAGNILTHGWTIIMGRIAQTIFLMIFWERIFSYFDSNSTGVIFMGFILTISLQSITWTTKTQINVNVSRDEASVTLVISVSGNCGSPGLRQAIMYGTMLTSFELIYRYQNELRLFGDKGFKVIKTVRPWPEALHES